MKKVTFNINYGGFMGCDEEHTIEVDDDASKERIENIIQEVFEEVVLDNCSWDYVDEEYSDDEENYEDE